MKTTLTASFLLSCFISFSQDVYFGSNQFVSVNQQIIFKGNLKIEDADSVIFKPTTNAKFNSNFEVITGDLDSDGKFIFENTTQKNITGNLIVDTFSIISNSKLNVASASTFQVRDLLELNGTITTCSSKVVLGESASNPGVLNFTSGYIDGNMKRWFAAATISDVLFPFGSSSYYSPAKISYTAAPNGGSITGKYILNTNSVYPISLTDGAELLENLSGDGFWQMDQTDGLNSGTYSIELKTNNLVGVVDDSKLFIVKRPTSSDAWGLNWVVEGNHVTSSLASGFYSVYRTGLTSFSQFGIASPSINPLPIELVSFYGICEENYTILHWQTASEHNASKYIVEKSKDGFVWESIGEVAAAGNSTQLLSYELKDDSRSILTTYYRLNQVDIDGEIKTFNTIATNCSSNNIEFSVFPNPVTNSCTLILNALESGFVGCELIDNYGKVIDRMNNEILQGENEMSINLENYDPGIYTLKLSLNNTLFNKKLIKL